MSKPYNALTDAVKLSDGPYDRKNLPIPDHEETIAELVAAGDQLIANEVSSPLAPKKELDPASPNPYIQARLRILKDSTPDRIKLINDMEAGQRKKDHQYDAFVREIVELGDKLSDTPAPL